MQCMSGNQLGLYELNIISDCTYDVKTTTETLGLLSQDVTKLEL